MTIWGQEQEKTVQGPSRDTNLFARGLCRQGRAWQESISSYGNKQRKLGESWSQQWLEVRTKKAKDNTTGIWREIMGREGWGRAHHKLKSYLTWKGNTDSKKRWNRGGRKNCSEASISEDKGLCSGEMGQWAGDCRNEQIRRDVKVTFRWPDA